ncbi:MAG: DUF58 domain-containing protein, partial [Planctomycetes bacterium]|nr:DUF58 domain-containing protein [Planctomycetota bacterium]
LSGLVYPKPAGRPLGQHCAPTDGTSTTGDHPGGDEFNGHRRYQTGDSQHHVDWKAHARGRSLLVKDFIGAGGGVVWCEWERTQGDDEQRLAQLAQWILEAHRLAMSYGLRLPGVVIAPAAGEGHYHHCMRALTLHGFPAGGDP